jgi:predicted DNA-binding protein
MHAAFSLWLALAIVACPLSLQGADLLGNDDEPEKLSSGAERILAELSRSLKELEKDMIRAKEVAIRKLEGEKTTVTKAGDLSMAVQIRDRIAELTEEVESAKQPKKVLSRELSATNISELSKLFALSGPYRIEGDMLRLSSGGCLVSTAMLPKSFAVTLKGGALGNFANQVVKAPLDVALFEVRGVIVLQGIWHTLRAKLGRDIDSITITYSDKQKKYTIAANGLLIMSGDIPPTANGPALKISDTGADAWGSLINSIVISQDE